MCCGELQQHTKIWYHSASISLWSTTDFEEMGEVCSWKASELCVTSLPSRLCSDHFVVDDFVNKRKYEYGYAPRWDLHPTAVPYFAIMFISKTSSDHNLLEKNICNGIVDRCMFDTSRTVRGLWIHSSFTGEIIPWMRPRRIKHQTTMPNYHPMWHTLSHWIIWATLLIRTFYK